MANTKRGYGYEYLSLILLLACVHDSCFCTIDGGDGGHRVVGGRCIESERRALFDIEKDIYDTDTWLSSWRMSGSDCCGWRGVKCDNTTGHVIRLDLRYPYPYQYLDDFYAPGASKLNPSLLGLLHLTYLDLSMNNFYESPIPAFVGSLVKLEYLNLSNTGIQGTIPPQLGNLSSLQSLDLSSNSYSIASNDLHWLSKMTSLHYLDLSGADLSKVVDWAHDIFMLPFLSVIKLSNTGLSRFPNTALPPAINFTSLTTVDLSFNNFSSTIPSWLLNISSLVYLNLRFCELHGELPFPTRRPSNLKFLALEYIDLSANHLEGPILDFLWNLTHLKHLNLDSNNFTGNLPGM